MTGFSLLVSAFPAPEVVWACLAASAYAESMPALRAPAWALAAGIVASGATTGRHTAREVAAAIGCWLLVARGRAIWEFVRRRTESFSNSWWEVTVGGIRLQSHGLFIGLALLLSMPMAIWLSGPAYAWWVFGATLAGGVGAALWAQGIEGSPQLLRPFGYFGGIVGVVVAIGLGGMLGLDIWRLLAAYCVALTFGQGLGRLRCMVNGCCHGRPASPSMGVRYTHPRTRVTRLSELGGVPIHSTQLYSLAWLALSGAVLLRLWMLGASLPCITGCYFLLIGLGRFVEEHFRGEPQTATWGGLRLYQWLALAFIVGGAALTTVRGAPAPAPEPVGLEAVAIAVLAGLIGIAAFGVDFPGSNRRFSRLS
jgi:prolipoprotein diacylglyceryltransferase